MRWLTKMFGSAPVPVLSAETEQSVGIIAASATRIASLSESINRATLLPLPVQTFPTIDNFTWENEKIKVADLAERIFSGYERDYVGKLGSASDVALKNTGIFFEGVQRAAEKSGETRAQHLSDALESLLPCSPKKITAEFQKQALAAGWSYVYAYNAVIDKLAETYPRCRSGIYMSRLKYSDVVQIAEEILTTLRACSTLMDDLQRRYDILEALQNGIKADLDTPESEKIWAAMKDTARDTASFGKQDGGITWLAKKITSVVAQVGNAAGNATVAPTLQIQGQMQRTQRVLVFFSTAEMFQESWAEWQHASRDIIMPNLEIMFRLKRDFFRNQVICMCDLITYNGYSLEGLHGRILSMCKE